MLTRIWCAAALLGCLLLTSAARAQRDKEPLLDREFFKEAFAGGHAEVKYSELADRRASSAKVKEFARQMMDDHKSANDRLTEYVLMSYEREKSIVLRDNPVAVQRIRFAVELAKRQLSEIDSATIDLPFIKKSDKGHIDLKMTLSRSILETRLGKDHPNVATSLIGSAQLLAATGHREEARAQLERAIAIREASFGPSNPRKGPRRRPDLLELRFLVQDHEDARDRRPSNRPDQAKELAGTPARQVGEQIGDRSH